MDRRYSKRPRDLQNVFAITSFRYIEVLFNIIVTITGAKNIVR